MVARYHPGTWQYVMVLITRVTNWLAGFDVREVLCSASEGAHGVHWQYHRLNFLYVSRARTTHTHTHTHTLALSSTQFLSCIQGPDQIRQAFSKRKRGLTLKAYQLHKITDSKVGIVITWSCVCSVLPLLSMHCSWCMYMMSSGQAHCYVASAGG